MNRLDAKNKVIEAGIRLVETGLIARTWGNVSCRVDEKTFVITPSGRDYLSLTTDEIVEINLEDLQYKGDIKPSSEKGIHREVYQLHPDINFVIHTHQTYASVVSAMNLDTLNLTKSYPLIGNEIICAEYALPGTEELCENVVAAMKISSGKAIILKNHGTVCMGKDLEEAFTVANTLEEACENYIQQIGGKVSSFYCEESLPLLTYVEKYKAKNHENCVYFINQEPEVVKFSQLNKMLRPLVDDFAQIIGIRMKTLENFNEKELNRVLKHNSAVFIKDLGAICYGKDLRDAEAVSMILSKNCKAYFAVLAIGKPKYISILESKKMRKIYTKQYSTLASNKNALT